MRGKLSAALGLVLALTSLLSLATLLATASPLIIGGVIISEIGWGGTNAGSGDEWIELYNHGAAPVVLAGWHLRDSDGGLNIALVGQIPPEGFFLLERTDDSTISDIPADQIYTGALANTGERLTLTDHLDQVVDTANGDGGAWPAGSAGPGYFSMERLDPLLPDHDSAWVNNNGVVRNGLDANGAPLNGTPRQPNAAWSSTGSTNVVIEAVLYDGYETGDTDEAVLIRNLATTSVDLSGWQLGDGVTFSFFPAGTLLVPGSAIWVTADTSAFTRQFGHGPALELTPWPGFANAGDEVVLLDGTGAINDVLVYEAGDTSHAGWQGPALWPYAAGTLFGQEGQLLYRRRDQRTGDLIPDSDSAADWAQDSADQVNGRKVRYPGWDLEAFFFTARITETATLTVAIAPDNALQAILNEINSAESSIQAESLTLESVPIADALAAAAARGVNVELLLEGEPTGGLDDQERYACQLIENSGGACWFMFNEETLHIADRYRFLHAKFMIIDGQRVVVSSENFSPHSLPNDEKSDGTWGRRGVILISDAAALVTRLAQIFAADLDVPAHQDLIRWDSQHAIYGAPPGGYVPITQTGGTTYTVRFPAPVAHYGPFVHELVQAPENSLRDVDALLGLLARAGPGDTILVQQLEERWHWGDTGSNPQEDPNPRVEALLSAARGGAEVRVLLDNFFDEGSGDLSNATTCSYLNDVAAVEHLDLLCLRANPTGLGLHNKMFLVRIDGRGWVHVGSLNGTELSAKGNREVALQVQSDGAYALLAEMFWADWPRTIYLPQVMDLRGQAHYPLITEVVYDPPGLDDAEFIEIANPTRDTLDLGYWSLGDAMHPSDFEDVRRFPAGTFLAPGGTIVIAATATGFAAEYGFLPNLEIVNSDPAVPDMPDDPAWGDPAALLQLGNAGDEVLLRNPTGVIVDALAYGSGQVPGLVACPLVNTGHSLHRYPYWLDTNDCTRDFRDWPFPDPGALP